MAGISVFGAVGCPNTVSKVQGIKKKKGKKE